MAEETPENLNEELVDAAAGETPEAAPEAPAGEAPEAAAARDAPASDAGDEAAAPAEAAPAAPAATRRDRLEQRREARRAESASRGPRTLEDRIAEREARRERNARQRRAYRARLKSKRAGETREGTPPAAEHGPGRPKTRQGIVVSDKADKTITVRVDVAHRHKRYRKIMRTSTTFHAHDERNEAHAGDTVRIVESRPMSRSKRWRLVEILERAR
jgi:small subunit ribosomal protein S17